MRKMQRTGEEMCNFSRGVFLQLPESLQIEMEAMERVAAWTECRRSQFIARMKMDPPQVLRMIDCKSTVEQQKVVVVDWIDDYFNGMSFTAVSHTYGMEVYEVFNCACASKFIGMGQTSKPRSKGPICPGHPSGEDNPYVRVVQDILGMCRVLWETAGVRYVWHDGVCIAQHDPEEVEETIKHIGWIYSTARETVIFLHYVGTPMPPISSNPLRLGSRWHTRVWTIQEAALSQRRCYCTRRGSSDIFQCNSFEDVERELVAWEKEGSSQVVVLEEAEFRVLILQFMELLGRLMDDHLSKSQGMPLFVLAIEWVECIYNMQVRLRFSCTLFPTLESTLVMCSVSDSKHMGDRINSIAALAGLKNFAVPKDEGFKRSIIKFFESLGQAGLATALFVCNMNQIRRSWNDSWLPDLSISLASVDVRSNGSFLEEQELTTEEANRIMEEAIESDLVGIQLKVLEGKNLELTGLWGLIEVQFNWFRMYNGGPYSTSSVGHIVLSMDVHETTSAYDAFIPGYNSASEFLGKMVVSRNPDRVKEPFKTASLAFPANKILSYVPLSADVTLLERKTFSLQGPRAILITPCEEANNHDKYRCIGRFFIWSTLRELLATFLRNDIMILKRLVIV